MSETITIGIPDKMKFLLSEKHRYKVLPGGRGSGKSVSMIRASIVRALEKKTRILCVRQFQNSIADSVHKLICDSVYALKLDKYFIITQNSIRCTNGSEYIFKGIHNNVQEIKSLEGVDLCLCEESQNIPDDSWEILIPTIRKEGSEFWICFNPQREDDATYRRFVKNPPDDCKVVWMNYMDNPWFPEVLKKEMEYCKRQDYAKYEHIWLGKTIMETEAQIFKGKFEVIDFEADPYTQFYYGADWGFACLDGDTIIDTDKGIKKIKDIVVGDMVLTRDGYKKVLYTKNNGFRDVYALDFGYKNAIIATGEHRIYTAEGWKRVDELGKEETLCVKKSYLTGENTKDTQTENTRIISIIKQGKKTEYITGICGNTITEKYQTGMLYTILTKILSTTALRTSLVSALQNIQKYIMGTNFVELATKYGVKTGTQKKIGKKDEKRLLKQHKKSEGYVLNVEKSSPLPMYTKSIVVQDVEKKQTQEIVKENLSVKFVEKHLSHQHITEEEPALMNVHINSTLLKEKREVYDITVENGEFFANGILVHNCDPTTLVRCFIENNCLYIDYEAYGVGVEMEEIPQLFDSIPESRKWKIRADCARPETVSYVARKGFNCVSVKKWQGSVEDGIEFIRSFDRIYIHKRCVHTFEEFKYYSYKKDRISGDILPIVVDAFNHCLIKGTLIDTIHGEKKIENIKKGDLVLTRNGYKEVIWAGISDKNRKVYKVITDKGNYIIGTNNHKVLTSNGFCDIDSLRYNDKILIRDNGWLKKQKRLEKYGIDILPLKEERIESILRMGKPTYTDLYGNTIMENAKKGLLSTIKMGIAKIIKYSILKQLRKKSIGENIPPLVKCENLQKKELNKMDICEIGINQSKEESGIKNTPKNKAWEFLTFLKKGVSIVVNYLSQKPITKGFVQMLVNLRGEENKDLTTLLKVANGVEKNLNQINMQKLGFVVGRVLCVEEVGIAKEVYDITVKDQHEFFANGILVHNCIDALRYALEPYIQDKGSLKINPDWEENLDTINDY